MLLASFVLLSMTGIQAESSSQAHSTLSGGLDQRLSKLQKQIKSENARMLMVRKEVNSAADKVASLSVHKAPKSTFALSGVEEDKLQKMKAALHTAAIIKKKSALHGAKPPAKEAKEPSWFADGPYFIAGLLVTILMTFCYCACSSSPTSMSGKYDLRSRV